MKPLLNSSGKDVAIEIADKLESCYVALAGNSLLDINTDHFRGQIAGLEKALAILGRRHEVKIVIKEVGKNE